MNLQAYRRCVEALAYGKRLPEAVYLERPAAENVPADLWAAIQRAVTAAEPDPAWNLLKLHTDQFALTFLSYPDFDRDPHPALVEATKINLKSGAVVRTDFRRRANPPILHRKETFLPPGDPRIPVYARLTRAEEEAGLYRDPSKIGLRLHWTTLLKRSGLHYEGHTLVGFQKELALEPEAESAASTQAGEAAAVQRHRTAIKRYDLSKPVKHLLERGLLSKSDTFFDYGCGHGMDIEALQHLGYEAAGWDPAFRPDAPKTPAAVVNLGYVLNVIEEPAERVEVLREAFALAERRLLVSTLVTGQESSAHTRPYRDGFLTQANTFQKFYAPGELERLIEETLGVEAATIGFGICVAFRSEEEAELFEARRNTRRIDWTEIGAQLRFSGPAKRERRSLDRYQLNQELFDQFWQLLLTLGRPPEPGEFDRLPELQRAAGGTNRAVALCAERHGERLWHAVRKARMEDTLVYLAMAKLRRHFVRRDIPIPIRHDIRSFFGDLATAQIKARDLLFAAGDPDEVELACEAVEFGWQDAGSLIVHRSLLAELPPILRICVRCAAHRYGDPEQADLIKIHKRSGKITFQHYDDFDGKPLPVLQTRIKINLRTFFVEVFDHAEGPKIQLLYFKERFVGKNYPHRAAMEKFSAKLRKLGLNETTIGFGPDREAFIKLAAAAGLTENLNPRRGTA